MRYVIARGCHFLLLAISCATMLLASYESYAEQNPVYKIGVLAFRGEDKALKRWSPTAEYLNQQIPNANFIVVPLDLEPLRHAVEQQKVDFVITNTGQYVELEVFYGVSRIATVKNNINGQVSTSFGAVIFTRADRNDINTIEDIKGKSFMGVKRTGFGGFQMAWREMLEHGVNPFKDLASLEFSGFPQDSVAYSVRDGLVDVGTFRSETLEQMEQEGKINLSDFKVLHPQKHADYEMLHSTRLYPVWPFARLKHTPRELSEKVASVLLNMSPDSEAAVSSEIMGWTIPVDYQPVHELMRELRVGPYAGLGEMTWTNLIQRYWMWLTAIGITLMLLIVVTLTLRKTNLKLQDIQRQLEKHQQELVDTVHARTADLVVMRDQALAASEAKSLFLSKVSHELRTPLNAIIGYTEIIYDELREGNRRIDIQDVDKVRISALHLLSIITDLLDITRLEKGTAHIVKSTFSISQMIGDVMSRAQPLAAKNGNRIQVRNHLGHDQIETDKSRLQDALDHVLDNACKYTSEGIITIDIEQHADGDNTWLDFRVIDNGIGISLEQQERIFNVFVQGDDSTTRRFDGLGLGLAKSRGYCRLMGGDISLNTVEGKGSEFIISVPVKVIDLTRYQVSA
ncbi:PhnD/SsuA/transferrin family substrate-binding protein [Kaarinaea lacus]